MRSGAFGLLMKDGQVVAQHRLFLHRFHEMEMTIEPLQVETSNGQAVFECPAFTWGVCVDIRGGKDVSDNCFDLLPGLRYTLQWPHSGEPQAQWVGSHALIRALQKQA